MRTFVDALEVFWDYLSSIQLVPLGIAIGCHMAKTLCTTRAWRNVLAAAYPEVRVRWLPLYAAYLAGVGVNALFPARAGDVVRVTLAHRAIPSSTYTTLVSSSLVLAIVDIACAATLFSWALTQGVLPGLDVLPSLPSFDFAWVYRHEVVAKILIVVVVLGATSLAVWIRSHVKEVGHRIRQAFTVVRTPVRWFRTVVLWQLADWGFRLATIWFMLGAFQIEQSLRNVLLVQAAESLSTLIPVSPGGLGTQQALLVYTLRGTASRSALLAFSVGMKLTLTAVNVLIGFAAILITLRTLRFGRIANAGTPSDPARL